MKSAATSRWQYAQTKEIAYQRRKIGRFVNQTQPLQEAGRAKTRQVLQLLDRLELGLRPDSVVLEIGSGAHGLIWAWPTSHAVGLDPLAHFYREALDFQRASDVLSVQAKGEQIPLRSATVDLVVTENVLDHTQDPPAIVAEISRVLKPGGVLYCLVDVHHWVWGLGARVYNTLFSMGLRLSVPAYPHHPFHFRRNEFMSLLENNHFDVRYAVTHDPGSLHPQLGQASSWRHVLMRGFPKNVGLAIVATAG